MSPLCEEFSVLWVPRIIFAQWDNTLAGCLMSPLCEDISGLLSSMYHLHTVEQFPENSHLQGIAYQALVHRVVDPSKNCFIKSLFEGCGAVWRPAGLAVACRE